MPSVNVMLHQSAQMGAVGRSPWCALALFVVLCAQRTVAAPPARTLYRRQSNQSKSPGNTSPQIWIPAVVVIVVLLVVFGLVWSRRGLISRLRWMSTAAGNENPTRELTAVQLAGGRAGAGAAATTTTTTAAARTARRTRRTPSQISTKSLPVYNKEPGDQELVIFRGPEDMEDEREGAVHSPMPSVEESAEGGVNMTMAPIYTVMPLPGNDMPLLNHDSNDNSAVDMNATAYDSTQRLMPARRDDENNDADNDERNDGRGSFETTATSTESGSALLRIDGANGNASRDSMGDGDERGEAPPYFEVVRRPSLERTTSETQEQNDSSANLPQTAPPGLTSTPSDSLPPTSGPETSSTSTAPPEQASRRRSGFRNFFGTLNPSSRPPVLPLPAATAQLPGHTRHRTSNSGSGSTLGLSAFRTISRTRSNNTLNSNRSGSAVNLTSPSALSVNSISSPLAHTLVRTEFRYPKSGPTPEQIRLITSTESLGRFAMPYGADAIAHAAQASRADLAPPPEFESPVEVSGEETEEGGPPGAEAEMASEDRNTEADGTHAPGNSSPAPYTHPSESEVVSQHSQFEAPPSSFKQGSSNPSRSESRASSVASFATAAESVQPASPPATLTINVLAPDPPSLSLRAASIVGPDSPATPTLRTASAAHALPGPSRPQSVVG